MTAVTTRRSESRPYGNGASIVAGDGRDAAAVVSVLNQALAIARFVTLRCERHYLAASRRHLPPLAAAALEHAYEAQAHADGISERIRELGGQPDAPLDASATRRRFEQREGSSPVAGSNDVQADAFAAIEGYRRIVASLASSDPTTKKLLEDVLSSEEERGSVLASLLNCESAPP